MACNINNVVPFREFKKKRKNKDYIDYMCSGYTITGNDKVYPLTMECEEISYQYVERFVQSLMECSATSLIDRQYQSFGAGELLKQQLALTEYNWIMSFVDTYEIDGCQRIQIDTYLRASIQLNACYLERHDIESELLITMQRVGCYDKYIDIEDMLESNISIRNVCLRLGSIDKVMKAFKFANISDSITNDMKTRMFNDLLTYSVMMQFLNIGIDIERLYNTNVLLLDDISLVVSSVYDSDFKDINEFITSMKYYEHFNINKVIYLTCTQDMTCVIKGYPVYIRDLDVVMSNLLIEDMREVNSIFNIT